MCSVVFPEVSSLFLIPVYPNVWIKHRFGKICPLPFLPDLWYVCFVSAWGHKIGLMC